MFSADSCYLAVFPQVTLIIYLALLLVLNLAI